MRRFVLALVFGIALGAVAPIAFADPPNTHEVLTDRPSGFWTSNRPAVGGAYRYRLLLLGCAIALTTGWLTWRLIRNTKR